MVFDSLRENESEKLKQKNFINSLFGNKKSVLQVFIYITIYLHILNWFLYIIYTYIFLTG